MDLLSCRSTLKQHVSGLVKTMPADCDSLAGHFSCPNSQCSTALTPRDIITVLDDDACAEVRRRREAQHSGHGLRESQS